jgi:hypothetical protein
VVDDSHVHSRSKCNSKEGRPTEDLIYHLQ